MSATHLHPLDFSALAKGSWLEVDELERATGHSQDTPNYRFGLLELTERIKWETNILTRIEGDRIRLMTDEESHLYKDKSASSRLRGLARDVSDMALVDHSQLGNQSKIIAEHSARRWSHALQAAQSEKRKQDRLRTLVSGLTTLDNGDEPTSKNLELEADNTSVEQTS